MICFDDVFNVLMVMVMQWVVVVVFKVEDLDVVDGLISIWMNWFMLIFYDILVLELGVLCNVIFKMLLEYLVQFIVFLEEKFQV